MNQATLIKECQELGVVVTAYSPLGSPDRPWAKPGDPILMEDPKLVELAEKYKKTVPQILLRYQVKYILFTCFQFQKKKKKKIIITDSARSYCNSEIGNEESHY